MANKRNLKKNIYAVCGDLASDALLAACLFEDKVDREKINAIINEIAALQEDTLRLVSFGYDKGARDFASAADYHAARRKYFATAYSKLNKDFVERAIAIVDQLNEVVPEEARKAVSAL